ncbi:MAG: type II CRISPR RNA-guided endonuclease Cas9 [Phycisphaerae bacterium]
MSERERIVLGLDIGISSIGWALMRLDEEPYLYRTNEGEESTKYRIHGGEIVDAGVRMFQPPHDRQKKSLALIRGGARRSRKTLRRKRQRMRHIVSLANKHGLLSGISCEQAAKLMQPAKGDNPKESSPWILRAEALERVLSGEELFRVMYHIAKHRGFSFLSQADEDEGEDAGKVKAGLKNTRDKLAAGNYETVGQMFAEQLKSDAKVRNGENDYSKAIHRSLLKEEIEVIFKRQRELGSMLASEKLCTEYLGELGGEKGIDYNKLVKMMNKCEFTGVPCAPREGYLNERFRLLNRLNTLELSNKRPLTEQEREKIIALAYENKKVTFTQIRKALKLPATVRFNLCSYAEHNPEFSKYLTCKVKNGEPQFEEGIHDIKTIAIKSLDPDTGKVQPGKYGKYYKMHINKVCRSRAAKYGRSNVKDIKMSYNEIRTVLINALGGEEAKALEKMRFNNISNSYAKAAEEFEAELTKKMPAGEERRLKALGQYIAQFEKDVFVELKGYHKIKDCIVARLGEDRWQEASASQEELEIIAEALVYRKTDQTRLKYLENKGIDKDIAEAVISINMKEVANFSGVALKLIGAEMEDGTLANDAIKKLSERDSRFAEKESEKQRILKPYDGDFKKNPVVMRTFSQVRKVVNAIVRKYGGAYPIDQICVEMGTDLACGKKMAGKISQGQKKYRDQKEAAAELCREHGLSPEQGQNLLRFRLAMEQGFRCPYSGNHIDASRIDDYEIDHIIPISRSFDDSLNNKILCERWANQEKKNRLPFEYFVDNADAFFQKKADGKSKIGSWDEFEVNTKHLRSMPWAKRKKLLTRKFTEEDKDKFISRNLNDTRYAARETANYLRKHFDFSPARRQDINEKSRIQMRAGRVTAMLRYHWGLEKDRNANDLHHALDAIVLACSTQGHVYLASMISKDYETKGKAILGRLKNADFEPWDGFRNDVLNKLDRIFVSRMPRRKVTGSANSDNPESVKSVSQKGRLAPINNGLCDMGTMVRADFYKSPEGKLYAVPLYPQDFAANKPLPNKYVDQGGVPYETWPELTEDFEFQYSLYKDEPVKINGTNYYISFIEGTRSYLAVNNVSGTVFENDKKFKQMSYKGTDMTKYSIDVLGNLKEIKKEKRVGNAFEKRSEKQDRAVL